MTITHLLENFTRDNSRTQIELSQVMLDEERLSSFEQGYQAGWDDSLKASASNEMNALKALSEEFSRLSKAHDEIYISLLANFEPLIQCLVDTVVPHILKETLGVELRELILEYIKKCRTGDANVAVSLGSEDLLQRISEQMSDLPVELRKDDLLGADHVQIHFGNSEELQVDLSSFVDELKVTINNFFETDVESMRSTRP